MTTKESEQLSSAELLAGPMIVTRYLGPTEHRCSRIKATHKRDNDTTWSATISWDHALNSEANHQAAAEQLLTQWPYETRLRIVGRGHDADAYYWLTATVWQDKNGNDVITHA